MYSLGDSRRELHDSDDISHGEKIVSIANPVNQEFKEEVNSTLAPSSNISTVSCLLPILITSLSFKCFVLYHLRDHLSKLQRFVNPPPLRLTCLAQILIRTLTKLMELFS